MTGLGCTSLKAMNADPTVLLDAARARNCWRGSPPSRTAAALALAVRLRREYPADLVAGGDGAARAAPGGPGEVQPGRCEMLFTRAGYEQSSSEPIARYRARGSRAPPAGSPTCAAGSAATCSRSRPGRAALAVDRDEVHARLALHNAAVYGAAANVRAVVADVRDLRLAGLDARLHRPGPPLRARHRRAGRGGGSSGAAADSGPGCPSRRSTGASRSPPGCPPSASRPPPDSPSTCSRTDWEAEFIADGRDLKEAVLWSPALATAPPAGGPDGPRRATVMSRNRAAHPGRLPR